MQPVPALRSTGRLDSTLLHEMLHVAVESQAGPKTPQWFREGLVLYLAGTPLPPPTGIAEEQAMRREYQAALARVRSLVDRNGRVTVMQWLRTGNAALSPR
jgi:stage II sporulation protein D